MGNGTSTGPVDSVASITLTAGSGYLVPPTVTLTSATGHGAIFTAQISAGAISGFTQVDAGSGYLTAPTVVITPGPPVEGLLIGTARTQFESVQLTITNNLMTRFWANRFVQFSQLCGRTSKLVVKNFYNATPDDRTAYEGISPQTVKFGLNNGTNYVQCIMNANNIIETLEDSLPLADVYTQTITISSHWDPAFTAGYYTGGSFSADAALPADLLLNIN